jgi:hypothetical protein
MSTCCPWINRIALVLAGAALAFGLVQFSGKNLTVADEPSAKLLRHVVLFKFKDSSTPDQVQTVVDAFRQLPGKIDEIADFEFGTNNSPEGLNDGFTHCFLVTFKSEKGRDAYLPHQAHQDFVSVLRPHLDKVLVVDYWAGK